MSLWIYIFTDSSKLGFIVPLAAKPEQCADAITPNNMYSSPTCAVSGAFLLAGGWCAIMWIFLRAFALHLQICWQRSLGNGFMWGAFVAGWGVPAGFLALALALSGVSFRFGATCHINHENSFADFWIPLLAFAGLTVIIQFATFGYCIKVYLASLADSSDTTTNSSGLPSYQGTIRTVSPRQAYRRVRRVIELQWRGIAIVLLIVADVVFFAVVFVTLDNREQTIATNPDKALDWTTCLVLSGGDKNKCLDKAAKLIVNEAAVMAVLVLLSVSCTYFTKASVAKSHSSMVYGFSYSSDAFRCSSPGMTWLNPVFGQPRNSSVSTPLHLQRIRALMKCLAKKLERLRSLSSRQSRQQCILDEKLPTTSDEKHVTSTQ